MEKILKNTIKFLIFILLALLPFITITQMIGLDTFLDSFEHPDHYIFLHDPEGISGVDLKETGYVILQKSTHPDFTVSNSDYVIYCDNDLDLVCSQVYHINNLGTIKRYYVEDNNEHNSQTIFEPQIIGKVINVIDDNIWNSISLTIWDISIHNLNVRALLTD